MLAEKGETGTCNVCQCLGGSVIEVVMSYNFVLQPNKVCLGMKVDNKNKK